MEKTVLKVTKDDRHKAKVRALIQKITLEQHISNLINKDYDKGLQPDQETK